MKIVDTVLSYAGDYHPQSKGMCRVRVFSCDSDPRVLITDLGELNNGRTVTDAFRTIVERIEDSGLAIGAKVYIEHHEGSHPEFDTFDQVQFSSDMKWKSISKEVAITLLACSFDELEDRTKNNKRIVGRTETLRLFARRFDGSPWPESFKVTKRKLEIADRMISRTSVCALVEAGSGERELQRLLKSDLSIFAEAFASPSSEYICFSELPIGEGFVDFAVFTGRSRMDVILIEVKGAEFNLVNGNHYQEFNHRVLQAAGQIRNRLGLFYRNPEPTRRELHHIRAEAERGSPLYNAFLGPNAPLQVDPDKDINIRSVIIGGRTQNDLEESRKRHDYERGTSPQVRLESWDTWLRRIQRI
ncbi:Shedu immune nuclease family protein [Stenotrophomonas maltophilia]|uniref:Shedu immune nuclease family protein n=1 Tax=Stenotrophomonas maltophilia TaxID=40324 RepID=UPI00391742C3